MIEDQKILFLGCGNMGRAIIKPLITSSALKSESILVIKPTIQNLIEGIKYLPSCSHIPSSYKPDIVFFCFKPQIAQEVISDFLSHVKFNEETLFISILAGKKIVFFKNLLGEKSKIIRLMPNLPTLIGCGISAHYAQFKINHQTQLLLDKIGDNIAVEKEELLDVVTAVSGSGPAYLFYFTKSLIAAAENLGLSNYQAQKLVRKTIYGSSKMMLEDSSDHDLSSLINKVASKGGTTEEALGVLEQNNFDQIILLALNAAFDKAKKL